MLVYCAFKQLHVASVSSSSGSLLILERSEVVASPTRVDTRTPISDRLIPVHPAMLRCSGRVACHVLPVTAFRRAPKIAPGAVESVAVDVIDFPSVTRRAPHQRPVQIRRGGMAISHVVPRRISFGQTPSPLVHPVSISGINDGVGSDAAISGAERNQRSILRLHRTQPPVSRPRTALTVAGVSCVNYTRSLRVVRS